MLLTIIILMAVIAIVFTLLGFLWESPYAIGFAVLSGVAWIASGMMMFGAELVYSTAEGGVVTYSLEGTTPLAVLFALIGVLVFVMVVLEAMEEMRKSVKGRRMR